MVRVGGDLAWERQSEKLGLSVIEWYEKKLHKHDLFFKLSHWLLTRADLIIVHSIFLAQIYTKYYGIKSAKIRIIPNPITTKTELRASTDRTIIYASRLVSYKNLPFVIKTFARIIPDHPDAKFIIIGDGPERRNLEQLVHELKIKNHVIFKGAISQTEVLEYTSKCLFAIAPALTEFNPNYIMQAISFGKPFLISRENGLPFKVPEDFLFDARNKEELRRHILQLLDAEGYNKAKKDIANIDFYVSWEDNLKANQELVEVLLKDKM